jgi:hypothetical protein
MTEQPTAEVREEWGIDMLSDGIYVLLVGTRQQAVDELARVWHRDEQMQVNCKARLVKRTVTVTPWSSNRVELTG